MELDIWFWAYQQCNSLNTEHGESMIGRQELVLDLQNLHFKIFFLKKINIQKPAKLVALGVTTG